MGQFVSNISITVEPGENPVQLCLSGDDADWFYLQGQTIRLNTSYRVLDREVQGSVLKAELICSEDNFVQIHNRILVEVENENDNRPNFLQETIQPFTIHECDARFFRIDLPSSGNVLLEKPLDYETRTQLELIIWAQESNTVEKFNTSAVLSVNIEDGDDQYPHFLPCMPVSPGVPVCMSPTYTANFTNKDQDILREFSPGPIRAKDGDSGINSDLIYRILSGDDSGRFVINSSSGEIRLTRAVDNRRYTPDLTLIVMVCQVDDRLKYGICCGSGSP
ncbi:cadherin-related family member 5 [Anabas testudineus]|uniref:cadherin-related family member 5 n=1 Tax=Anabas testudineus TaxID=64144 RepID=UPI000E453DEF|nr:cadherin-related family member 5 [Anabas testudineus]